MFVAVYFIGKLFSPTIYYTFLLVFVGAVLYFTCLIILREPIIINILKKFMKKLKKNKIEQNMDS
jgi:hypothetical protein